MQQRYLRILDSAHGRQGVGPFDWLIYPAGDSRQYLSGREESAEAAFLAAGLRC